MSHELLYSTWTIEERLAHYLKHTILRLQCGQDHDVAELCTNMMGLAQYFSVNERAGEVLVVHLQECLQLLAELIAAEAVRRLTSGRAGGGADAGH